MSRLRNPLITALSLYLLLLPLLSVPAAAQPRGRGHGSSFEARGLPMTLDGFNGFKVETLGGAFHHDGHVHLGGLARFESPWGEEMRIRYWSSTAGTVSIEFDRELTVRYSFDDAGRLQELAAETDGRRVRTVIANRAEEALFGLRDVRSFDLSVYEVIDDVFRGRYSEAFIRGLGEFEAPASASCATATLQCAACIVAWVASVGGLLSACIVGGVPTFGAACFAAILIHEATNLSCAAACISAWEQCNYPTTPLPDDPVDDGCSGPGDAE